MPVSYVVTPEALSKFKEPFGILIEGSPPKTMRQLRELVEQEKPAMIISVGDTVSRNLHASNLIPQLAVTDNRSMRQKLEPQTFSGKEVLVVRNPQGHITQEAIYAIQKALQKKNCTHIVVEGEEDLLTLIAVLFAPLTALVIYGQPSRGVVAVKVTPKKKREAQTIFASLKAVKQEKGKAAN